MVIYLAVCKGKKSTCLFLGVSHRLSPFVSSCERLWGVFLCARLLIIFITRLSVRDVRFPFKSRRYTAAFFMDGETLHFLFMKGEDWVPRSV